MKAAFSRGEPPWRRQGRHCGYKYRLRSSQRQFPKSLLINKCKELFTKVAMHISLCLVLLGCVGALASHPSPYAPPPSYGYHQPQPSYGKYGSYCDPKAPPACSVNGTLMYCLEDAEYPSYEIKLRPYLGAPLQFSQLIRRNYGQQLSADGALFDYFPIGKANENKHRFTYISDLRLPSWLTRSENAQLDSLNRRSVASRECIIVDLSPTAFSWRDFV
ncbi:unnamed protein product, partial [Notodromas monacha]